MVTAEELKAQFLIIQGYYTRIGFLQELTKEQMMSWLQDDLDSLQSELAVYVTNNIIDETFPHETDVFACLLEYSALNFDAEITPEEQFVRWRLKDTGQHYKTEGVVTEFFQDNPKFINNGK